MLYFANFAALEANMVGLPNYVMASFVGAGELTTQVVDGTRYENRGYRYAVEIAGTATYLYQECLVQERLTDETNESLGFWLTLPNSGGPSEYVPHPFSLAGWIERDGSAAKGVEAVGSYAIQPMPVEWDGDTQAFISCDIEDATHHRASFWSVFGAAFGFEVIIACWARLNEGDFARIFIDAPCPFPAWAPDTAYAPATVLTNDDNVYVCIYPGTSAASGGPQGTGSNITDGGAHWMFVQPLPLAPDGWVIGFEFGGGLTLFGDNPQGTPYPPVPNNCEDGRASWVPAGYRIRADIYMAAVDPFTGGDTYPNGPASRGPVIDFDILGKNRR